jgi:hypothetical protein
MRTFGRFAVGFGIGCILIVWSVGLAAAGHGTFAPLVSAVPELFPLLMVAEKWGLSGFWLVVVPIAGLLWATYFGLLPAIKSFGVRMVVVCLLCLVHFEKCRTERSRQTVSFAVLNLAADAAEQIVGRESGTKDTYVEDLDGYILCFGGRAAAD